MVNKKTEWFLFDRSAAIYRQLLFWSLLALAILTLREYPHWAKGLTAKSCVLLQIMLEFIIPYYLNSILVMPFLWQGKIGYALLLYAVQIVALVQGMPILLDLIGNLLERWSGPFEKVSWKEESFAFKMIAYTVIATVFKLFKDNLAKIKQQKEGELRHLQNQLNPHFLFNTLNNLYGLACSRSEKLPGLMLQLSDLLRYSIYDTNMPFVKLDEELRYIKNYIELEKIRLEKTVDIHYLQTGTFQGLHIAPMIIIAFVENSFKHFGQSGDGSSYIQIAVAVDGPRLDLTVKNSIPTNYPQNDSAILNNKAGIGLENAKRRLDLLYRTKYALRAVADANSYHVFLTLSLHL